MLAFQRQSQIFEVMQEKKDFGKKSQALYLQFSVRFFLPQPHSSRSKGKSKQSKLMKTWLLPPPICS